MPDKNVLPVTAGLAIGVAFVIGFTLAVPAFITQSMSTEIPIVKMLVKSTTNEPQSEYSGESGSYCWRTFGCADTPIIVSDSSINLARGTSIAFSYSDGSHNIRAPDSVNVLVYNLNQDLKVLNRGPTTLQATMYELNGSNRPLALNETVNQDYVVNLASGEYVLLAESGWNGQDPTVSIGDVTYFYRIHVE